MIKNTKAYNTTFYGERKKSHSLGKCSENPPKTHYRKKCKNLISLCGKVLWVSWSVHKQSISPCTLYFLFSTWVLPDIHTHHSGRLCIFSSNKYWTFLCSKPVKLARIKIYVITVFTIKFSVFVLSNLKKTFIYKWSPNFYLLGQNKNTIIILEFIFVILP